MASSPSSSSRSWKYDVFLSFRGDDTRKTFVDHLYTALVERVTCTYKDDEALPRGDTIGPSLLNAIDDSQIAIIIFSENYANSSWCLDELAYIMNCKEERGLIVMPIFYHVAPTDVRKQKSKYEEAFAKHEFDNNSKIESWREALVVAANIAGWEISHNENGYEAKCIKDIVGTILDRLLYSNSVVDESLVGMGTRLQDLKSQLKIGSGGVLMVGIWGIGGGGKTTLASSLYIEISSKFDSCCFLGNIKEESTKSNGMETLQRKFLSDVLKTEVKVESVDIGKHMIKSRLGHKKVLIVLDDIDDCNQLEALAGSHDWFGDGSRIIITTRDEHLLRTHRVDNVSHVSLLSDEEANRLFDRCAFNRKNLVEEYETLSQHVVSYAGGLPLAIKILGKFLYDKNNNEWISILNRLKGNPEMKIVEKLKISYDGLEPIEKELFLDIACFWRGEKKDEAMEVLDACGFHPGIGVRVLIQKALITISSVNGFFNKKHDVFEMHDLVEEMGHYIVRGEHPNNPEKHSRLWRSKEIEDICCTGNATTENNNTEAIKSSESPSGFGKFLSKAKKLRLLHMNKFDIEAPEYLSNELRYVYLRWYPARLFPESLQARKLVVLRLESTLQKELWKGKKYLPCLKTLEISLAAHLVRTPDFDGLPSLEKLRVMNCPKIKRIEGNFHALKNLKKCEIGSSYNYIKLPKDVFNKHIHLEELHLKCTRQPCNFYLPRFITRLTLNSCVKKDGDIPRDIGELSNLQELDLSGSGFSVIISISLLRLTRLKLLNLSYCDKLVKLPQLPISIAILIANDCKSLEQVGGDIVINKNCKFLSRVSICKFNFTRDRVINGGEKLLETMLQGNAIKNGCMFLKLYGVEIPKWFRPRLVKGKECSLKLAENWFNHFSGFLFCAASRILIDVGVSDDYSIIMKHDKGGGMDSEKQVFWETFGFDDVGVTWVGYISFGLLKQTSWWDPTSTHIHFSLKQYNSVFGGSCTAITGIGVRLVSKTSETVSQLQSTTTESSSDKGYKCNFLISHDSRSHLECTIW